MDNQASEDSLRYALRHTKVTAYAAGKPYVVNLATVIQKEDIDAIQAIIRTEKLKLLDEVIHQSTVNLKSAKAVSQWAEIRIEQLEKDK